MRGLFYLFGIMHVTRARARTLAVTLDCTGGRNFGGIPN